MPDYTPKVSGAQSARRILQTLFYFDGQHPEATVDELSDAVQVLLPTAYCYVALLREMGILEEGTVGTYHLSPRVLALAEAVENSFGVARAARPVLRRLCHMSGETVLLVRLVGHAAVCVDRVEAPQPIRPTYQPGQSVSLQQGASARLLIGGLGPDERAEHLDWLEEQDPGFASKRAAFEEEISQAATDGCTMSRGEIDAGIVAVAAAVKLGGRTVASISIAGPAFRAQESDLIERRKAVLQGAAEISQALLQHSDGSRSEGRSRRSR